jgi:UDP-N-acetylglucosamine:LPS N-acetylglucosamine transferase
MMEQPGILLKAVRKLVKDKELRLKMARKLSEFAKADAAERLAKLIMDVGS